MAEVKDGDIGAAIDGPPPNQDPSKFRQFVTDPRNLATMLVLGSALAQNRQGQSFGGHLGRAAVGSLAFRGGLDKGIADTQAAELEAESVQNRRAEQTATEQARIAVEQDRNRITEENYGVQDANADADRASRERIAGIQRTAITPPPMTLEDVYRSARKDISDAYAAWYAGGQYGPAPDDNAILARHLQMWDMQSRGVTVGFEPSTPDTETTVDPAEQLPDRPISPAVRTAAMRRYAEVIGLERGAQMSTQDVDLAINNYDRSVLRRAQAGEISPEEARTLRSSQRVLLSTRTRAELQRIEQAESDMVRIPTVEENDARRTRESEQLQRDVEAASKTGTGL